MDDKVEQEVLELISVVAIQLHHRHRTTALADADDIRQELWLWFDKRRDKMLAWVDPTQDENEVERGWHALRKSLYRQGDKYCRTQKAKRLGYHVRDEVFYSEAILDELLPHVWDLTDDIGQAHDDGSPKPPPNPAEGGNRIVSLFDVQVALKAADDEDRKLLMLRYRDGIEPSELAKLFECSRTTIDRRLRRALKRLSDFLGGESPWGR